MEVGHGIDQAADEGAHALRSDRVDLPAHVLVPTVGPHRQRLLEVARVDRLEVAACHRLCLAARDAFAFARHLLDTGGRLLHLGARLACAILLGPAVLLYAAEGTSLVCAPWRR